MGDGQAQSGVHLPYISPVRAARGPWRDIGLGQSFAIHLFGLFIWLFGFGVLDVFPFDEIFFEASIEPLLFLLGVSIFFFAIQSFYLVLGALTVCFGAGCESWGQGYRRTLSRWYQLTPWHAMLLLVLTGVMQVIDEASARYYDHYYELGEHTLLELERAQFLFSSARFTAVSLYGALTLWLTLATLAVHRDRPTWCAQCLWPARCEACGYALAGLDDDQSCPECGMAVHASKHAPRKPIKGRFWATTLAAVLRPSTIGSQLLTRRPTRGHYRTLAIALLLVVLCGPISVAIAEVYESLDGWGMDWTLLNVIERFVFGGITLGIGMAVLAAGLCLATGSLHALFARLFAKRDALPAAAQACCLTAGLMPLWALAGTGFLMVLWVISDWMYERNIYDYDQILLILWLMFHSFLFVLYFALVGRICRAARFANI